MQPPIGQKPETDPYRKIGSRSFGAVGKLSLSLPLWLSVANAFFFKLVLLGIRQTDAIKEPLITSVGEIGGEVQD